MVKLQQLFRKRRQSKEAFKAKLDQALIDVSIAYTSNQRTLGN